MTAPERMFLYLPFNAPHDPLQVPEKYYAKYKALNMQAADFPDASLGVSVYTMLTNTCSSLWST